MKHKISVICGCLSGHLNIGIVLAQNSQHPNIVVILSDDA